MSRDTLGAPLRTWFDPARVAVVADAHPDSGNILVRGNIPLTGTDARFATNEIASRLGLNLAKFSLGVVMLIDNVGERFAFEPEVKAFGAEPGAYPATLWPPYSMISDWQPEEELASEEVVRSEGASSRGRLWWWPIEGISSNELVISPYIWSNGWNFAGLCKHLDMVWSGRRGAMLNAVIYFHCMLGADRTGAAHAGFLLESGRAKSADEALLIASKATPAGAPAPDYVRLVRAYAERM